MTDGVAPVVMLYESNFRDPSATLRKIANQIDAGKFGEVGCLGLVIMGDTIEVFGAGTDSAAPSVAMLLHGGFMRLSEAIAGHGRSEE